MSHQNLCQHLVKSDDFSSITDEYVSHIYWCIEGYIEQLKSPMDIYDCIWVHGYIRNSNPSFDELLEHGFCSRVSLKMLNILCKSEKFYSVAVKMEKMRDLIEASYDM